MGSLTHVSNTGEKTMATRKARMSFAVKRFRSFLGQFRKSKRGIAGLVIVAFFSALAVFAPIITPYAPIEPMMDVGKYPVYGPTRGPPIAAMLCVPSWYRYLPGIAKGPIGLTETFESNITIVPQTTQAFQLFGPEGEIAVSNYILLSKRAVEPPTLEATFPNGSSRQLVYSTEWNWRSLEPSVVNVPVTLPSATKVKVIYSSATDVTENIQTNTNFQFNSDPFANGQWEWTTDNTVAINVRYSSTAGFEQSGAIELIHTQQLESGTDKVVISKEFEYPYWEPPKSFWGHISYRVSSAPGITANISVSLQKENETPYTIINFLNKAPSLVFSHERISSTSEKVWNTVGSMQPNLGIFPSPGNYTLALEVAFNRNQTASVLVDNFNMILYGNSFGLLGTDNALGYPRDIFSTLVYGTQVSLIVGVLSAIFGTIIGLFLGLVSGYVGGIVDETIMRVADLLLVLPTLPLFIILVVALKTVYGSISMWNIIIVLTLFGWMGFARTVRSMVLSLRERAFIEAAKASGAKKLYIINRHVIPNVFALVYITLATSVPGAIITEASLSWLGLGDPMIPSWGKLLYDFESSGIAVTRGLTEYWFWMFPASISIALLATAFILMGYALDEILNPRLRQRR